MKTSIKTLTYYEILYLKKFLILFFVILTLFSSIIISIFSTSVSIPRQFNDILSKSFENGTSLSLINNYSSNKLFSYGADYITLTAPEITSNISIKQGNSILENCFGEAQHFLDEFNKNSYFSNEENVIIAGNKWIREDNKEHHIWVSQFIADKLNLTINDSVVLSSSFLNEVNFIIKGIYKYSEEFYTPDFIFSYEISQMYISESTNVNILLNIYNVFNTPKVVNELRKNDVEFIDFDGAVNYVNSINYMNALFWTLTMILIIVTLFVIFNFLSMIINSREKLYGLLKILGVTNKQLMIVCFFIIFAVNIIAVITGTILSIPLNNYFSNLATNISGLKFKVGFLWYVPLSYLLLSLILISILLVFRKHKFKKISPLDILIDEN